MRVTISKSTANGTIKAQPSKSYSHRLLIASALSNEECTVNNVVISQDIHATIGCLFALGYEVDIEDNFVRITIANHDKLPEISPYGGRLKLTAKIGQNEDTVNAGWNFVNFIKDCASSANRVRQKYYNEAIEKGEDTVRGVKGRIYLNALAGLSNTDLPKTLF